MLIRLNLIEKCVGLTLATTEGKAVTESDCAESVAVRYS